MVMIAVVRVRGGINLDAPRKETMKRLNLHKQNYCVMIEEKPELMGMIHKVKDYVTWGQLDPELEKKLKMRQEKDPSSKKAKPFLRLNPPRKGFGRKGIKQPFIKGGALGNRGKAINSLIERMIIDHTISR